jgi:hypothetical protein
MSGGAAERTFANGGIDWWAHIAATSPALFSRVRCNLRAAGNGRAKSIEVFRALACPELSEPEQ